MKPRKNGERGMKIVLPPHNIPAQEVAELTQEVVAEIEMMQEMVKRNNYHGGLMKGYALAHPQVSEFPLALFVMGGGKVVDKVVINPKIIEASRECKHRERCLSFPSKLLATVKHKRFKRIKVSYQDENLQHHEEILDGLISEIFQHEIEHLNGKNIYGWNKK